MIIRLIILLIIIWLGFRIYKTLQVKKQNKLTPVETKDMVSCDTCGIHLPVDEAIKRGEKYFCSRDHLPKKD